jgi:hypothetical protein
MREGSYAIFAVPSANPHFPTTCDVVGCAVEHQNGPYMMAEHKLQLWCYADWQDAQAQRPTYFERISAADVARFLADTALHQQFALTVEGYVIRCGHEGGAGRACMAAQLPELLAAAEQASPAAGRT